MIEIEDLEILNVFFLPQNLGFGGKFIQIKW